MQRRFAAAPSFPGQWPRDGRAVAGNATLQDFEAHCEAMPAAGPAIIQALLLISIVFGFTWWLGGRLGLDDKLRALLASAVSICGVSAAIAAAGAVQAKREQLAYAAICGAQSS